jgi:heme oxygenase
VLLAAGRRVLRLLKDETAGLHLEAERHVRILDATASLDEYRRYLAAMAGYHGPLERLFAGRADLEELGFAACDRKKSHLLVRDLRRLGVTHWPACVRLPAALDLPRTIGIAYVIEGSTLGGRFILSRLPPAIAAMRGTATAFLEGYGAATGDLWRAFGGVVERGVATAADERAAVEGARDAFTRLIDWLALHEASRATPVRELG